MLPEVISVRDKCVLSAGLLRQGEGELLSVRAAVRDKLLSSLSGLRLLRGFGVASSSCRTHSGVREHVL